MLNLYVGLDVDPRATSAEIKVAYAVDQKAAEKAAAARAALDRLLLEVFKPLVDSGVELARQHLGRKPQRRQPAQPCKTKPATKAARPSSQG